MKVNDGALNGANELTAGDLAGSIAIAIMVKTPGLSPIKTRLAAGIGEQAALEFYQAACRTLEETVNSWILSLKDSPKTSFASRNPFAPLAHNAQPTQAQLPAFPVVPYWAVAEEQAKNHPEWQSWSVVVQGPGDLGARLHSVYAQLRRRHRAVLLIGADSPQMDVAVLENARSHLLGRPDSAVLGLTCDGGFYLIGAQRLLSQAFWDSIPYSTAETGALALQALRKLGHVGMLSEMRDVDYPDDLAALAGELSESPFPAREALRQWLEAQCKSCLGLSGLGAVGS